ncbi:MAG: PQQ-binding-like beta-propeller repeat protein [Pseudohongiella sp.]|nr:PQQ-binding-like beta-propeller repeat protein [Pseudohongiella sp.]
MNKILGRLVVAGFCLMSTLQMSQILAQEMNFTTDQADRGQELYVNACAVCHLPSLQGAFEAPALKGGNFVSQWSGRQVNELHDLIEETMPVQAPGSLTEQQYVDIVAYILLQNDLYPTLINLTADSTSFLFSSESLFAAETTTVQRTPTPGVPGNVRSPEARDRAPEIGELHESETAHTRIYQEASRFRDITSAELANPSDGDWTYWRRNPQSHGYSPLDQINRENVKELSLAWVWGMEPGRSQPGPLVRSGVMYVPNTGNLIQALDAATGTILWEYRRLFSDGRGRGALLRTLALWEDMIYVATADAHLVALDARTGKVRWDVEIADHTKGFNNTSGPIVADGIVINGINGCQQFQLESCFITGHDGRTGQELWRTFTIQQGNSSLDDTWGGLPIEFRGGGDVWIPGSWDPQAGQVFFGIAQAKPWMAVSRGLTTNDAGLYANSTVALDIKTGEIVWHRQHIPGESLDMDEAFEQLLIDLDGQSYVFSIGKTGILWKLDRVTGRFQDLIETLFQNAFDQVNRETGELTYRQDIQDMKIGEWLSVCPSTAGGHNWQSSAYYPPKTTLVIPLSQSCMEMSPRSTTFEIGSGGNQGDRTWMEMPGTNGNYGKLSAFNVKDMSESWSVQQRAPFLTAAVTTAGGLVFIGDYDRWVHAYDIDTGEELWRSRLGSSVMGFPISYEVDGTQYIAITTGRDGGSPWRVGEFLTPELVSPSGHNAIYVFKLSDR